MTAEHPGGPRPIRSYVLRQGRMTVAQREARERLFERYAIPFSPVPFDLARSFGRDAPRVMEIGFGMGETTAEIAAAHPELDYLALEVHAPGVGSLLRLLEQHSLVNVRIIQHDAVDVLERMIAPHSLHGIHIFFPDPWPKKRHHKRRLLQLPFARLVASRLDAGGYLHLATDWKDYADWMLEVLVQVPELANAGAGFVPRPECRPLTKFERRGLRLGHAVYDIVFRRVTPRAT